MLQIVQELFDNGINDRIIPCLMDGVPKSLVPILKKPGTSGDYLSWKPFEAALPSETPWVLQ